MLPLRSTDMRSMDTPWPMLVAPVAIGLTAAGACAHTAGASNTESTAAAAVRVARLVIGTPKDWMGAKVSHRRLLDFAHGGEAHGLRGVVLDLDHVVLVGGDAGQG